MNASQMMQSSYLSLAVFLKKGGRQSDHQLVDGCSPRLAIAIEYPDHEVTSSALLDLIVSQRKSAIPKKRPAPLRTKINLKPMASAR
jgi:hypothetical protein